MSAPPTRRVKDRGGDGGVKMPSIKPSKSITPGSVSDRKFTEPLKRSSSAKENPRSSFRAPLSRSQKPAICPLPRIDKAVAAAGNDGSKTLVRSSTSSIPRGRSSSPSEFLRVFSDMSKVRGSRFSMDRCERVPVTGNSSRLELSGGKVTRSLERGKLTKGLRDTNSKVSQRSLSGSKVLGDGKENMDNKSGIGKISEMNFECSENMETEFMIGEVNFKTNHTKPIGVGDICNDQGTLTLDTKSRGCVRLDAKNNGGSNFASNPKHVSLNDMNGVDLLFKDPLKPLSNSKTSETTKEKGISEEGAHSHIVEKYPSRLHEKLAFLEGKVKKIASDIKKTKEMLDTNNPESSKEILLDIHDKILGIEKAMVHVPGDSQSKTGISKSTGNGDMDMEMQETSQNKQVDNIKNSVKGLNTEELEARFFPHHKLLKDRTSSKASIGTSHNLEGNAMEPTCIYKADDNSLSHTEESPIELEFLAFLNKEKTKVTTRDEHDDMEFFEAKDLDGVGKSASHSSYNFNQKNDVEPILTSDETLDEFEDQENKQQTTIVEEMEDILMFQLNEIGCKTSTGGWFVSEGESVLLAHDDGSCSFYDMSNCEEKAVYKPLVGVLPNIWRDCWVIRAPGADGCSGRYVVAASAGNAMDSGFCSWDFYTKDVTAVHVDGGSRTVTSRTVLGTLPKPAVHRRNTLSNFLVPDTQQWWYKPCGPLIVSTSSCQQGVSVYDIRDGEQIMKWDVPKPVAAMDYSSPLQWRNRGKIVVAETETISLWDVNSLNPEPLLSVSLSGRKISALHVNNTDAEVGGGVRQRVSSADAEGNDGVFCTSDSINILDFRTPTGLGFKIPKLDSNAQSVFSRGDSVFLGCTDSRSSGREESSQVLQFSLRKQRLLSCYTFPESNIHCNHKAVTQVWGNSNLVMGVSGSGLFVFDALKDDGVPKIGSYSGISQEVKEVIGPDDLYSPSFDYSASHALLISRDRPAMWRCLS